MTKYLFNPCKLGRHPALAPLGDALASFYEDFIETPTEGCPCCMAVRILLLAASSLGIGLIIGAQL